MPPIRRRNHVPITENTVDYSRVWPTVIFILVGLFYWIVAWYLERITYINGLPNWWASMVLNFPLLEVFQPIALLVSSMFHWRVLRHFVPVIGGAYFAYLVTGKFVRELFDLPDETTAQRFLARLHNGQRKAMPVRRKTWVADRQASDLLRIGGPGKVAIQNGEVVVTEMNGRYNRILGPGGQRLARFEQIKSVLDLRDQERNASNVVVTTKEGLEIETGIEVVFRLHRGNKAPTPQEQFPFDDESIRTAAYLETVGTDGQAGGEWDTLPLRVAVAELRRSIAKLRLDELIDPGKRQPDPHPSVQRSLERDVRHKLHRMGIQLISARLTALTLPEQVHKVLVEYWQLHAERPGAILPPTQAEKDAAAQLAAQRMRERMIQSLARSVEINQERPRPTQVQNQMQMAPQVDTTYRILTEVGRLIARSNADNVAIPGELTNRLSAMLQLIAPQADSTHNSDR